MRKWLMGLLGISTILGKMQSQIDILDRESAAMRREMQTRLDENRFLSRKLDMLSQGVATAPEIIKGQDEAQEC